MSIIPAGYEKFEILKLPRYLDLFQRALDGSAYSSEEVAFAIVFRTSRTVTDIHEKCEEKREKQRLLKLISERDEAVEWSTVSFQKYMEGNFEEGRSLHMEKPPIIPQPAPQSVAQQSASPKPAVQPIPQQIAPQQPAPQQSAPQPIVQQPAPQRPAPQQHAGSAAPVPPAGADPAEVLLFYLETRLRFPRDQAEDVVKTKNCKNIFVCLKMLRILDSEFRKSKTQNRIERGKSFPDRDRELVDLIEIARGLGVGDMCAVDAVAFDLSTTVEEVQECARAAALRSEMGVGVGQRLTPSSPQAVSAMDREDLEACKDMYETKTMHISASSTTLRTALMQKLFP